MCSVDDLLSPGRWFGGVYVELLCLGGINRSVHLFPDDDAPLGAGGLCCNSVRRRLACLGVKPSLGLLLVTRGLFGLA